MGLKKLLKLLFLAIVSITITVAAQSKQQFFRIGTGGMAGTYYPIGGILANAISNPPGSRPCDQGGSCGVPGLIAIAQSANGSVANINAIKSQSLESGFAQSDVVYWAYTGTGIFAKKGKASSLRVIASLFPESIHLVVRKGSGIKSVQDIKGKRVSLDEPGSGTLVDARLILQAYGLSEQDLTVDYIKPGPSVAKIKDNQLDAFFVVAGYPTGSVVELAASVGAELVPIDGPQAQQLVKQYPFFAKNTIPANTYENVKATPTLSVTALWVVNTKTDNKLVYGITKALWNQNTRKLLDHGHAKGKHITLENATKGIGIPLHPGAEQYYREQGLIQ